MKGINLWSFIRLCPGGPTSGVISLKPQTAHENHANEGKVDKQKLAVASYEKEPTPKGDQGNGFQKEFGVFVFVERK